MSSVDRKLFHTMMSKKVSRARRDKISERQIQSGDYTSAAKWEKKLDSQYTSFEHAQEQEENKERECILHHKKAYEDADIKVVRALKKRTCQGMGPFGLEVVLSDDQCVRIRQQYYFGEKDGMCFISGNLCCPKCDYMWKSTTYSFSLSKYQIE